MRMERRFRVRGMSEVVKKNYKSERENHRMDNVIYNQVILDNRNT